MLLPQNPLWEMTFLDCPDDAWPRLLSNEFDTVVLDIDMPGNGALELLDRIKENKHTGKIPVVMLAGAGDCSMKSRALEHGADDLLNKPVDPVDLLARLNSALRLKTCQDALDEHDLRLEETIRQHTSEVRQSYQEIAWKLGKFAEKRDKSTGHHVIRVGLYSRAIAETLELDPIFIETIGIVAPLHDVGKIGVSDFILLKKEPLTPQETFVMRRHCWIGAKILREESKVRQAFLQWHTNTEPSSTVFATNPYLKMAATIAMGHHEKWDGTGYPQGLCGEAIPLEARIVAIADVFDAVTSERPYRPAYSEEWALELLQEDSGSYFDPRMYSAFMKALPKIRSIRQLFVDAEDNLVAV